MQCNLKHDSCRNTKIWNSCGQNLATIYMAGELDDDWTLSANVKLWLNEIASLTIQQIILFPTSL